MEEENQETTQETTVEHSSSLMSTLGVYSIMLLIASFAFAWLFQTLWSISFVSYIDLEEMSYWQSYGFVSIASLCLLFRRAI